jgi:hypothetical protein
MSNRISGQPAVDSAYLPDFTPQIVKPGFGCGDEDSDDDEGADN